MINLLIILFVIVIPILWIWALIDMIKCSKGSRESLGVWLLIILFFPIVGSIIYFQIGRKRMLESREFNPNFKK